MKSYCLTCSSNTNHEVIINILLRGDDFDNGWWQETKYQIIACKGYDTVSFRILYNHTTMQMFQENDAST